MIVCFDTNVLVSALATRGLCADVFRAALADHRLVVGETVLAELQRVLRQKLKLQQAVIEETDAFLRRQALVIGAAPPLGVRIRDASDAAVLAEAVAGKADVLVTGDQDLLAIAPKAPIRILSPRGFWELLRGERGAD